MRIRKINFDTTPWEAPSKVFLCLIKFFGARSYRICGIPDYLDTHELRQVLNTVCKAYHKGIWYLDEGSVDDVAMILLHMDIQPVMMCPDVKALS